LELIMDLDTRREHLSPFGAFGRVHLLGLLLLIPPVAQAADALAVGLEPGVAVLEHNAQEFAGREALECFAGETLSASSEVWAAVVVYWSAAGNRALIAVVNGAEALTSAGAVQVTDAQIAAAVGASTLYTVAGQVLFRRDSGDGVIIASIDHACRSFGIEASRKRASIAWDEDSDTAGAAYVYDQTIHHTIDAADIADGDVLTDLPLPPFKGKIASWRVVVEKAITTGAKTADLDLEIGATSVTGAGITYAGTKALGVVTEGGTITAANTFNPGDTLSIVADNTTPFTEGRVRVSVDLFRQLL
jgi:hypothetical protein